AQVDTPTDIATGGVYRSDDAGATWKHVAGGKAQVRLWQRGWYFGGITVDPKNPDVVYVMNTATYRSEDGGKTFVAIKGSPGGDDYHTLWINPADPTHMVLGSDQGVTVSLDRAQTWSSWLNQPTAQMYHVITDNRFPYWVYGAQQDSGAIAVQSESMQQNLSNLDSRWMAVGGESGTVAPDPNHPGRLFGSEGTYEDLATGWAQNVDASTAYPGHNWRQTWTMPIVISAVDGTMYTSRQRIFATHNGGKAWTIISPDLTRGPSEDHPANLDPATLADSSGLPRRGVVYSITPAPHDAKRIWAGTDDGYVWLTNDGGAHWKNITPPQIDSWSKVGMIDASAFDANTAYVAVDRHRLNDYKPYIYETNDSGAHWRALTNGIPDGSFVNVVRADPKTRGLLFAGTELGIYVSFDGGNHWQSLQRNLPTTSVRDIAFNGNDLIVATHGRSFWALDDIAPMRQMAQALSAGGNYLYETPLTYRVRRPGDESTPLQPDEPHAPNKPLGLYIDYYLHGAPTTPVVINVLGPRGHLVRRWSSADKPEVTDPSTVDIAPQWIDNPKLPSADPGAHRFVWNFAARNENGPLVPPGTYTIQLAVDGHSYMHTAVLARDPRIHVTDAQLHAQYVLANAILGKLAQLAKARTHAQSLLKSGKLSKAQLATVRGEILGLRGPGDPDDSVGKPPTDFTTLRYLEGALSNLEYAVESADAEPTHDQNVAFAKLSSMLESTIAKIAAIAGPK
ncbi:MAG TPA: hypothetical protein VNF68_09030, partial [Candidatus Baltobacteraceae bacterium]|nr:hypothetical protein [Candidatus Baltobacteraceae bacterium]